MGRERLRRLGRLKPTHHHVDRYRPIRHVPIRHVPIHHVLIHHVLIHHVLVGNRVGDERVGVSATGRATGFGIAGSCRHSRAAAVAARRESVAHRRPGRTLGRELRTDNNLADSNRQTVLPKPSRGRCKAGRGTAIRRRVESAAPILPRYAYCPLSHRPG